MADVPEKPSRFAGFLVLPLFLTAILGCEPKTPDGPGLRTKTFYYEPTVVTLEHDGHKFVWAGTYNTGGNLIHHPGCDCIAPAPVQQVQR